MPYQGPNISTPQGYARFQSEPAAIAVSVSDQIHSADYRRLVVPYDVLECVPPPPAEPDPPPRDPPKELPKPPPPKPPPPNPPPVISGNGK